MDGKERSENQLRIVPDPRRFRPCPPVVSPPGFDGFSFGKYSARFVGYEMDSKKGAVSRPRLFSIA